MAITLVMSTTLLLSACDFGSAPGEGGTPTLGAIATVCDRQPPGPAAAPGGAVVVDPAKDNDLRV
ncbi:MAG TPA: right-handed parallel beta-helix repeat-containing protein, partial [Pseudonocardiaceae bacterium]|nr:right-handed parallel beta-helix repeat-containing protein [Pseudonocardiaceae bacterium]